MVTTTKKSAVTQQSEHQPLKTTTLGRAAIPFSLPTEPQHELAGNEAMVHPVTQTTPPKNKSTSSNNQRHNLSTNEVFDLQETGPSENDNIDKISQNDSQSATRTATSNNNSVDTIQESHGLAAKERSQNRSKTKQKRLSEMQHLSMETQLLSDIASTISTSEKHSIYKQFEEVLAKISDKEQVLSMEEVLQIIQDWKPKQEILCLYVRIARKLPANFHLDSISTLLCISKQCGYTPVNFLTKTKS